MKNEEQQVLRQAYHLVNGLWTDFKTVSKKDIKLLEYSLDDTGNADYILVKILDNFEIEFSKNGSSWSYRQKLGSL